MAEFVEGFEKLSNISPLVTVFGSARTQPDSKYYQIAEETALGLSNAGFNIISGGGPGIMEAANKGGKVGTSSSIGVNVTLPNEQLSNRYQDISLYFQNFFIRKVMLVKYSSAYIVFPGGFGTLDELAETLTLLQTKKSHIAPIILVGSEFWQDLLGWIEKQLVTNKLINQEDLDLFTVLDEPGEIIEYISTAMNQT